MPRLLHIARKSLNDRIYLPEFVEKLNEIGAVTLIENGADLSEEEVTGKIRDCDILLTGWQCVEVPLAIADDPGDLRYICNVSGSVSKMISLEIIDSGIPVTNWGDAPANRVAEGAVVLLMTLMRDICSRKRLIAEGGWKMTDDIHADSLYGMKVGVYGCGVIGQRFIEMIRPFKPELRVFDPYIDELPAGCERADTLEELCDWCETLVLHAGLSDETRGAITAELLAKLPDDGIVINTARGGIFDQDALFAELEKGRLRAGLDVLEPDGALPLDHPARQWPNLILTAHNCSQVRPAHGKPLTKLDTFHNIALDNMRRHLAGEPLRFIMDRTRYLRST